MRLGCRLPRPGTRGANDVSSPNGYSCWTVPASLRQGRVLAQRAFWGEPSSQPRIHINFRVFPLTNPHSCLNLKELKGHREAIQHVRQGPSLRVVLPGRSQQDHNRMRAVWEDPARGRGTAPCSTRARRLPVCRALLSRAKPNPSWPDAGPTTQPLLIATAWVSLAGGAGSKHWPGDQVPGMAASERMFHE